MRCGSQRHCSKQGAKWLRWGITAKCSLCLLAVVVVVVVVAVYRLALLASSPFRFEAICIHNMHAKSESELRSRKTEIVANASALLCSASLSLLRSSHVALPPSTYYSLYPDQRHITCNRLHSRIYARATV